jgi:hypothetical protein
MWHSKPLGLSEVARSKARRLLFREVALGNREWIAFLFAGEGKPATRELGLRPRDQTCPIRPSLWRCEFVAGMDNTMNQTTRNEAAGATFAARRRAGFV